MTARDYLLLLGWLEDKLLITDMAWRSSDYNSQAYLRWRAEAFEEVKEYVQNLLDEKVRRLP